MTRERWLLSARADAVVSWEEEQQRVPRQEHPHPPPKPDLLLLLSLTPLAGRFGYPDFFASRLPCALQGYKQIKFFFFCCKNQPGFSEPKRAAVAVLSLLLRCANLTKTEICAVKGCVKGCAVRT